MSMNNSELPAMPISVSQGPQGYFLTTDDYGLGMGLTKREHFAAMAMQGIYADLGSSEATYNDIAEMAVKAADALLKELSK